MRFISVSHKSIPEKEEIDLPSFAQMESMPIFVTAVTITHVTERHTE